MGMTQSSMMVNFSCQTCRLKFLRSFNHDLLSTPSTTWIHTLLLVMIWCARYTFPNDPSKGQSPIFNGSFTFPNHISNLVIPNYRKFVSKQTPRNLIISTSQLIHINPVNEGGPLLEHFCSFQRHYCISPTWLGVNRAIACLKHLWSGWLVQGAIPIWVVDQFISQQKSNA